MTASAGADRDRPDKHEDGERPTTGSDPADRTLAEPKVPGNRRPEVTRQDLPLPAGPTAPQPTPRPAEPAEQLPEQPETPDKTEPPAGRPVSPAGRSGTTPMALPEQNTPPAAEDSEATRDLAVPPGPVPTPPSLATTPDSPVPGEATRALPHAAPPLAVDTRDGPVPDPRPAPVAPPKPTPGARGANWHRFHYPIGVFLLAYGLTGLLASVIGWGDREEDMAVYFGAGLATPALAAVKVVEILLVVVAGAGLARRRDVWFLPALVGWLAGFGAFGLLDVVKGRMDRLTEHLAFLTLFAVLLFLSYALGVRARVREADGTPAPEPTGVAAPPAAPPNLSRTQEMALAALDRWQRSIGSMTPGGVPAPPPPAPGGDPGAGTPDTDSSRAQQRQR